MIFLISSQIIPCQVLEKPDDKEDRATVEASKVKEVGEGRCRRGKWLSVLNFTGEILNFFPLNVILPTIKA